MSRRSRTIAQDAVYEPRRVVRGVALRERDRLVDRDLVRNVVAVELVQRDRRMFRSIAPSRSAVQPSAAS
jgi:hypothetical protein